MTNLHSKSCGNCGKDIPLTISTGDKCPHCNAVFSSEQQKHIEGQPCTPSNAKRGDEVLYDGKRGIVWGLDVGFVKDNVGIETLGQVVNIVVPGEEGVIKVQPGKGIILNKEDKRLDAASILKERMDKLGIKEDAFTPKESNKKEGSFIATAVYGDQNHPSVCILREYRDQNLLKSKTGQILVNFYYRISPNFVKPIKEYKWLKCFFEAMLDRFVKTLKRR
jgi:hypothetical protein